MFSVECTDKRTMRVKQAVFQCSSMQLQVTQCKQWLLASILQCVYRVISSHRRRDDVDGRMIEVLGIYQCSSMRHTAYSHSSCSGTTRRRCCRPAHRRLAAVSRHPSPYNKYTASCMTRSSVSDQ